MPDALVSPDLIADRADVLPPAFACSWTGGGPTAAWVHVVGELDVATTPRLVRTLGQAQLQARLVVLDLRGLAFLDSTGVHAVVNATDHAREFARRLVVLRGPPEVDRVFTLSGTDHDLEICDLHRIEPSAEAALRRAGEEVAT